MYSELQKADDTLFISVWERVVSNYPDISLGLLKIFLNNLPLNKSHENWFQLQPRSNQKNAPGKLLISLNLGTIDKKPMTIDDFSLISVIGKGSFGRVQIIM